MRQRQWIALAAAVPALIVGYFLGHSVGSSPQQASTIPIDKATADTAHSSAMSRAPLRIAAPTTRKLDAAAQPLPPPKTPLLSVFNELKSRADSGDGAAASRLFHDVESCRRLRFAQEVGDLLIRHSLNEPTTNKSAEELIQQDQSLDRTQKMINFVRDNTTMCAGVSPNEIDATVPIMLLAAQSGDLPALDCYVGLEITSVPGNLIDHPEWLTQYKHNALALAQSALERGDWHVVKLLEFAYSSGSGGSELLGYVTGRHPDPEQAYRYQKLQRLGASGDYAAQLDSMYPLVDSSLNRQQIAAADAWAQDVYSRYFQGTSSNELGNWESACPDVVFY